MIHGTPLSRRRTGDNQLPVVTKSFSPFYPLTPLTVTFFFFFCLSNHHYLPWLGGFPIFRLSGSRPGKRSISVTSDQLVSLREELRNAILQRLGDWFSWIDSGSIELGFRLFFYWVLFSDEGHFQGCWFLIIYYGSYFSYCEYHLCRNPQGLILI